MIHTPKNFDNSEIYHPFAFLLEPFDISSSLYELIRVEGPLSLKTVCTFGTQVIFMKYYFNNLSIFRLQNVYFIFMI